MNFDRDLVVQVFFGIVVLGGGVAICHARFIRPIREELDRKGRATLLLIALTLSGGSIGACGWFLDDPRSFSWDLPPLASRMLGAAGWAFAGLSFLALRRPTWPRVSLVLQALGVYLVPIGAVALLAHHARFDPHAPITYAFFFVVIVMSSATIAWWLWPSPSLRARRDERDGTVAPVVRTLFVATAIVVLPWSIALFASDTGPTRFVWAWPGDLLSSRLIAVMLATIGVGALTSRRSSARAQMSLVFQLIYGIGVVAAGSVNAWNNKPVPTAYLAVLGVIALASGAALGTRVRSI